MSTSAVEVTKIGPEGIELEVAGEVFALSYAEYPWFRFGSEDDVRSVSMPESGHLRWDVLDIDLTLDALRSPWRYPLRSRVMPARPQRAGGEGHETPSAAQVVHH